MKNEVFSMSLKRSPSTVESPVAAIDEGNAFWRISSFLDIVPEGQRMAELPGAHLAIDHGIKVATSTALGTRAEHRLRTFEALRHGISLSLRC